MRFVKTLSFIAGAILVGTYTHYEDVLFLRYGERFVYGMVHVFPVEWMEKSLKKDFENYQQQFKPNDTSMDNIRKCVKYVLQSSISTTHQKKRLGLRNHIGEKDAIAIYEEDDNVLINRCMDNIKKFDELLYNDTLKLRHLLVYDGFDDDMWIRDKTIDFIVKKMLAKYE